MQQCTITGFLTCEEIEREYRGAYKPRWDHVGKPLAVVLRPHSWDYDKVNSIFNGGLVTMASGVKIYDMKINRIMRVVQQSLLEPYSKELARMMRKYGETNVDAVQKYLFHGTEYQNIDRICSNGFNPRHGYSKYGAIGYLGVGAYFSPYCSVANSYTTGMTNSSDMPRITSTTVLDSADQPPVAAVLAPPRNYQHHQNRELVSMQATRLVTDIPEEIADWLNPHHGLSPQTISNADNWTNLRYMFLARVLLGRSAFGAHNLRPYYPSPCPHRYPLLGPNYDSATDEGDPNMQYAVYRREQMYPAYIIEYRCCCPVCCDVAATSVVY